MNLIGIKQLNSLVICFNLQKKDRKMQLLASIFCAKKKVVWQFSMIQWTLKGSGNLDLFKG